MKILMSISALCSVAFIAQAADAQSPSMRGAGSWDKATRVADAKSTREPASAGKSFTCNASDDGLFNSMDPLTITVSGSKLAVSYSSDGSERKAAGKLDPDYKPRGKNNSQIRFKGDYESLIDESGSVVVIANKNILAEGTKKSWVKLQWQGESFESSFYHCTLIP